MANITVNYKGYILPDSYTIKDKTYVPISVTSHKDKTKVVVYLDVYKMGKATRISRVGILFKGMTETNIKFNIDNSEYVMSLKDGLITSMAKYKERNIVLKSYGNNRYQTLNWLLSHDETYKYQMLGRMQSDCVNYPQSHLWGININDHIWFMRELYNSMEVKPEWISSKQIDIYERRLSKEEQ